MQVIYSKINLFTLNQPFYLLDTETGEQMLLDEVETSGIPQWLKYKCYEQEIFNVHLYGNNEYLTMLEEKLLEEEIKEYGEAKIKVEVN